MLIYIKRNQCLGKHNKFNKLCIFMHQSPGVVQRGHGAVVWVARTCRVICAVVSSTSHVSRRSSVASGNKRARIVVAGVEMKAVSSLYQGYLWGNGEDVSPQHQVGHA
jgi:hypothetical protein